MKMQSSVIKNADTLVSLFCMCSYNMYAQCYILFHFRPTKEELYEWSESFDNLMGAHSKYNITPTTVYSIIIAISNVSLIYIWLPHDFNVQTKYKLPH